jgi:hypothetical protein
MPLPALPPLWDRPPEPSVLPEGIEFAIEVDGMPEGIDPDTGATEVELEDGSVVVDFAPNRKAADDDDDFNANLADELDPGELNRIAEELLQGIDADDQSREEWLSTRSRGLDLLGLKLEDPRSDAGSTSAPLEGMSTVRHPLLLEAVLRFQANARGELLPADGPVKVRNDGKRTFVTDIEANALQDDMNHYLTAVATEYYPDTDRMLFMVGFGGTMFKKVYHCPIRNRPVSESVDAKDIIVSNATTDLANAGRVTQRITMRRSVLRRMQLVGAYRDIALQQPVPDQDKIDKKVNQIQGTGSNSWRPEDQDYTIYEAYAEIDIKGHEHTVKGKLSGLPLPYKVTIDKTSRQILEIRRNWKDGDDKYTAKKVFVPYQFVPGLGFYAIGLLQILGNTDVALTAAWRLMLDAGMFANFPGFLYVKNGATRQTTNQFRVPPGGGAPVDTGGGDIRQAIMPLPYKEPGQAMMALVDNIAQTGQRVGGTAELPVGEGKQDAPVGTTLALLEQAAKIMDAVHKRLHAAQAEEFQLLKELFKADPAALTRYDKTRADWDEETILLALDNYQLVPVADPNTPSHMHRLMKAMAIKQLQGANPDLYDARAVDTRVLGMLNIDDPESLFAPPKTGEQPMVDPVKLLEIQQKDQDSMRKFQGTQMKIAADLKRDKDKEDIEILKLAQSTMVHPENNVVGLQTARVAKGLVQ